MSTQTKTRTFLFLAACGLCLASLADASASLGTTPVEHESSLVQSMWSAIASVTSGLTFIAFLTAFGMAIYRWKLARNAKVVQSAPESEHGQFVLAQYGFFNIDTPSLTQKQKYDLVLELIRREAKHSNAVVAIAAFATVLFACVTAYALANQLPPI